MDGTCRSQRFVLGGERGIDDCLVKDKTAQQSANYLFIITHHPNHDTHTAGTDSAHVNCVGSTHSLRAALQGIVYTFGIRARLRCTAAPRGVAPCEQTSVNPTYSRVKGSRGGEEASRYAEGAASRAFNEKTKKARQTCIPATTPQGVAQLT